MNQKLCEVLKNISDEYMERISNIAGTRNYLEVDIGKRAGKMGFSDLREKYQHIKAVVPLKAPTAGMKVRIDGRTFVNYIQSETGLAVPGFVAKDAGMLDKIYVANDSMILNF